MPTDERARADADRRAATAAQRPAPKPAKLPTLPAPAALRRVERAPAIRQLTRAGPERFDDLGAANEDPRGPEWEPVVMWAADG